MRKIYFVSFWVFGALFITPQTQAAGEPLELWRLSAYMGKTGDSITVTGKGFVDGQTWVYFDEHQMQTTVLNSTTLLIRVGYTRFTPTHENNKTFAVSIRDSHGQKTPSQDFYVQSQSVQCPEFWRLSKYSAKPGETITAYGKFLGLDGNIAPESFYYPSFTDEPYSVTDPNIPSQVTKDTYTFTLAKDIPTNKTYQLYFSWNSRIGKNCLSAEQGIYIETSSSTLELWRLSDYAVFPGKTIQITGTGFLEKSLVVKVGDTSIAPSNISSNQLSISIPTTIQFGKTYPVKLKTISQTSSSQDLYIKDPRWEK